LTWLTTAGSTSVAFAEATPEKDGSVGDIWIRSLYRSGLDGASAGIIA
jgi:hypothetical protein